MTARGEHGYQAWFALNRRFEPSVAARHGVVLADLVDIMKKPAKNPGELQSLLTEINRRITLIEDITGQPVPDMMSKTVLLGVLDPLTRQHTVAIHAQSFPKIRARVLEFASNAVPAGAKDVREIGRVEPGSTLWGSAWGEPAYNGYVPPSWNEEDPGGFNYAIMLVKEVRPTARARETVNVSTVARKAT